MTAIPVSAVLPSSQPGRPRQTRSASARYRENALRTWIRDALLTLDDGRLAGRTDPALVNGAAPAEIMELMGASGNLAFLPALRESVTDSSLEPATRNSALDAILTLLQLQRLFRNATFQSTLGNCLNGSPFDLYLHNHRRDAELDPALVNEVCAEIERLSTAGRTGAALTA